MRAIVHIGMHKTGTTSVKDYFRSHRDALLDDGILYPTTIGDMARNIECKTKDPTGLKNAFASELAQIPDDGTVFFSSENYFNLGDAEKARMIEFLSHFDLEITLLCYLRPQVRQVVSHYQQHVKECFRRKQPLTYSNAIERFDALIEKGYYKYSQVLDKWCKYVARKSIYVRVYGRDVLPGGCTVKDVASLLGIEVINADIVKRRISLSAEKLYFLKTMTTCIEKSDSDFPGENRQKIMRVLNSDNTGLPLDISSEEKSYVAKACAEDNKRLAENYLDPGIADFFLEQDVDLVIGKVSAQVRSDDVAGIYLRLKAEVSILRSWEPLFLNCLNSNRMMAAVN